MNAPDTLTMLFRHHQWANLQLLEFCAGLTPAQMGATVAGAFGTLQETLEHVVKSERSYLSRITTGQPLRYPTDAPPLTIAEMAESFINTGNALLEWVGKIRPQDAVWVDWDGVPRSVPLTLIVTQTLQHASEHREQIKTILTHLGLQPPDLQAWKYFEEIDGE